MGLADDHLPLLAGQRRDMDLTIHGFGGTGAAKGKGPRIARIMEHPQDIMMLEVPPHELALVRPTAHPPGKGDVVLLESADGRGGRPRPLKGAKEEPDGVLDLPVGIENHAVILRIAKADR